MLRSIRPAAAVKANDDPKDLAWQRWPVLTIHVGDGMDPGKLRIPKGVTLSVVPGGDAAARKRIANLLERMKAEPRE